MAAFVVLLATVPVALASLEQRFAAQKTTFFQEDREREAFEKAAFLMLSAKPLGVGANHYVFVANTEGYSDRAGVNWRSFSRATNVHNSYLLIAAESGWPGLFAFLLLLGTAIAYAFGSAFRFRKQPGSEVFVGLGAAVLATSLHALFEWMYVVYSSQYLLAGALGLIAGMRSRYVNEARAGSRLLRDRAPVRRLPLISTVPTLRTG